MKVRLGRWVKVDFTQAAKDFGVADDFNKKIFHHIEGFLIDEESYSRLKIEEYKDAGVPVIDLTLGREVPDETKFISKFQNVLGAISVTFEG